MRKSKSLGGQASYQIQGWYFVAETDGNGKQSRRLSQTGVANRRAEQEG